MLTIRSFRNEYHMRLLDLWTKSQRRDLRCRLVPLTYDTLHLQVLGVPFSDPRSIMLAFDDDRPVGYVHTTLGPRADGYDLSSRTGQICFLAVDPDHPRPVEVARELITAAERYLVGNGVEEIYGGSPRPCAPFYIGFFGGAEAIGYFDSDVPLIQAFRESGYEVLKNTVRFCLNLKSYTPPITMATVDWLSKLDVRIDESPKPKTWWEACMMATYPWIEAAAYLQNRVRPIARVRVRVSNPNAEEGNLYGDSCSAGLMDVLVHPDFRRQGVGAYTLGEMLRHLVTKTRVAQVEAHIADDAAVMYPLLRSLHWDEADTGKIFLKKIENVNH